LSTPKTLNLKKQPADMRVVFGGVAFNCANHLERVLDNIRQYASNFKEAAFVFVENDSTDGTKQIFDQWRSSQTRCTILNMDGLLSTKQRTLRLEAVRNACLEFIRTDTQLKQYDYIILTDMDDVGSFTVDKDELLGSIEFLEASPNNAAVFANQEGAYYDLWALRHPGICPGDVWEQMLDRVMIEAESEEAAYEATFKDKLFRLSKEAGMIEVESAFGGFGIYKCSFAANPGLCYVGSKVKIIRCHDGILVRRIQTCEHVHFHAGIRKLGGRLFINPKLINRGDVSYGLNRSSWSTLLF
jgi:glycosyltransferase involved in cell wall biosynthesis